MINLQEPYVGEDYALAPDEMISPIAYHRPVLRTEVLELLRPEPGDLFIDGTLGGGGHSEALLEAGARVIGIDQDPEAIAWATQRLAHFGRQFTAVHANFADAEAQLDALGATQVQGVLLDLGASSHQLDEAERGFSFAREGPLDMRMDPRSPVRAADLVNTMSAPQLEKIFRSWGEEPNARRIAVRLVRERAVCPFVSTAQLAAAVESVVPRRGRTHPATRVFQALRIAVNRELEVLGRALGQFTARLAPGARFGVISFHSLEDRPVKQYFRQRTEAELDHPSWPAPRPNPDYLFEKVTGKAVTATPAEAQANPRARSARLRVVEKR